MELTTETKVFLSLLYFDVLFSDNSNGLNFIRDVYGEPYVKQRKRIFNTIVKIMEENQEIIDYSYLLNAEYVKSFGNRLEEYTGDKVDAFFTKHEKNIDWNKIFFDKSIDLKYRPWGNRDLSKLEMMLNNVYKNLKKKKEEEHETQQQLQPQNELLKERINVITDELLEIKKQVGKLLSIQNQPVDLLNFSVEDNDHGEINQA